MVEENYIYVDKTEYIYNLIEKGRIYFLSRPRRFGKTLLVSVLEEIFSGNRHLFKGYWIYDRIKWKKYPVIHLDFLGIDYDGMGIEESIIAKLDQIAGQYGIQLTGKSSKSRLGDLIEKLVAKEKERVVVLIDEYDKPIIDYIENENLNIAKTNRKKLGTFYSILKYHDRNIKFLFITGVSRFPKVSIFSDLNNLDDITSQSSYSKLIGYTREEIELYFGSYLDKWTVEKGVSRGELMAQLKKEYNGYSWDGAQFVYNPDSIHKSLNDLSFGSYWFSTGTPNFLVKKLKEQAFDITDIENMVVKKQFFDGFDIIDINIHLLLFQTGYLTIKESFDDGYKLYYPNKEVQSAFFHLLLEKYSNKTHTQIEAITPQMNKALSEKHVDSLVEVIRYLFAGIPYHIFLSHYEAYFHSIILTALKLSGIDVIAERETNLGRIDIQVKTETFIYILEFKIGSADVALNQILYKKYFELFLGEDKEIILLGMGFSQEDRNISSVRYISIAPGTPDASSLFSCHPDICSLDFPPKEITSKD